MLGLSAHFSSIFNTITIEPRPRHESPKFSEDRRAPTINALYKYEMDPEIIEDSSPIKDKFSEYKPVDRKANKYFTLDQEEEEYDRRKQKEKSLNKITNYRDSKNYDKEQQGTTYSRFNERSDSRGRVGVLADKRDKSGARGGRSGVKDTKEFVRELEEEEKRKRLDLDKIYRQAGLYQKK